MMNIRPHLNPLPRGEDLRIHAAVFRQTVRPIPPLVLPETRRTLLLLLGEKAGMRENVKLILKFVIEHPPSPKSSPPGEDLCVHAAGFSADRPANPAAGISKDAARVSPSPRRRGPG